MGTDDASTEGVWRDEERLPLADLTAAVATSATDGQADDLSGNDAGIEQTLEEQADETGRVAPPGDGGDPDATGSAARALRTDFTGPTGPH
jgi:hypothetical protein